ncbi:Transferrin-like protein, partial [Dinothrombium tinctorium]
MGNQLNYSFDSTKYNDSNCLESAKKESTLWFSTFSFVKQPKCWLDAAKLYYDSKTKRSFSQNGVTVKVPELGPTESVEYIAPLSQHFQMTKYFATLVEKLEALGYRKNVDLKSAPRDWRKAPHELDDYFTSVKTLVENTFEQNGKRRVILVGHSMGGNIAYAFLRKQNLNWKNKHITALLTVATPWGGNFKYLYGYLHDDDYPANMFPVIREAERSFPAMAFLLPQPRIFAESIFIQTPNFNYSIKDFKKLFEVIKNTNAYNMYLDTKDTLEELQHPETNVFCIGGSGFKTMRSIKYEGDDFQSEREIVYGDGDQFVNDESLRACLCVSQSNNNYLRNDYQVYAESSNGKELIWCTISAAEQKKCLEWSETVRRVNSIAAQNRRPVEFEYELKCELAVDKDQCLNHIDNGRAQLVTLDPGEIYLAGRLHSLVPIASEQYGFTKDNGYYTVAVVKKSTANRITSPLDLKSARACFPGVGKMAGWIVPLAQLVDIDILPIKDCNNMVKSAANFFNVSCAPNALIDKHNPTGDNPHSICALCSSRCSGSEPYKNFDGAFKCLDEAGDVAFIKHNTVDLMIKHYNQRKKFIKPEFELLCPQGGRASLSNYRACNWGFIPAHAVVTISSILPEERLKIQNFLIKSALFFGNPQNRMSNLPYQTWPPPPSRWSNGTLITEKPPFILFGEPQDERYGDNVNLLFSDDTTGLLPIEESSQTYSQYLKRYIHYFDKLKKCPVPSARLCVVSDKEYQKCEKMSTAFRTKLLQPKLSCIREHSTVNCMKSINEGNADLVVLDAGDIYRAGHNYNLMPIIAEQYDLNDTSYYVVAIAKQSDKDTDLLYLKGKRSCHTGFNEAAGWVMPISFLLSNNRMRSYGCDSAKAVSEFFQKSCAPGALLSDFNPTWSLMNLCGLCHGSSSHFCARDSSEPFYGDTGALRCLVEGGGEIAFARHTTILENTAGRNPSFWSRNVIPDDFELLCRDGSRGKYNSFETCNLGKVASNAIVTSKDKDVEVVDAYVNLFLAAQQLYSSKYSEDYIFKMFVSNNENLIFQDATSQLRAVPDSQRDYRTYLGYEFIKAMKIVDCTAASASLKPYTLLGERKCFIEEIPDETLVLGKYKIELHDPQTGGYMATSPSLGMHVEVRDPDDKVILSKVYSAEGKFSFTSHTPGEHVICLYSNSSRWFANAQLRVHLDIQVGEHAIDYAHVAQKEKLSELQLRVRQLLDQVEQISKEQNYQRYREERFRQTSESTNSRVLWWSLGQTIILLAMGFWQMRHLKSFFEAKKLV